MLKLILGILFSFIACNLIAHPGIGIVCDKDGNIFFTDLNHVWKIDLQGTVSIAVKDVHTHQLRVDSKNVYGEHVWYAGNEKWAYYLWSYHTESAKKFKTTGDITQFPENNKLVQDNYGNSYFSKIDNKNDLLYSESVDGIIRQLSSYRFEDIRWIAFQDAYEKLIVVDNIDVYTVDQEGSVNKIVDNLGGSTLLYSWVKDMHKLMGVWTDNQDNVYVSHFARQKVLVFSPLGELIEEIESPGSWSPTGGIFDQKGNLWLLEYNAVKGNSARVRRIDPLGNEKIFETF